MSSCTCEKQDGYANCCRAKSLEKMIENRNLWVSNLEKERDAALAGRDRWEKHFEERAKQSDHYLTLIYALERSSGQTFDSPEQVTAFVLSLQKHTPLRDALPPKEALKPCPDCGRGMVSVSGNWRCDYCQASWEVRDATGEQTTPKTASAIETERKNAKLDCEHSAFPPCMECKSIALHKGRPTRSQP